MSIAPVETPQGVENKALVDDRHADTGEFICDGFLLAAIFFHRHGVLHETMELLLEVDVNIIAEEALNVFLDDVSCDTIIHDHGAEIGGEGVVDPRADHGVEVEPLCIRVGGGHGGFTDMVVKCVLLQGALEQLPPFIVVDGVEIKRDRDQKLDVGERDGLCP